MGEFLSLEGGGDVDVLGVGHHQQGLYRGVLLAVDGGYQLLVLKVCGSMVMPL